MEVTLINISCGFINLWLIITVKISGEKTNHLGINKIKSSMKDKFTKYLPLWMIKIDKAQK